MKTNRTPSEIAAEWAIAIEKWDRESASAIQDAAAALVDVEKRVKDLEIIARNHGNLNDS